MKYKILAFVVLMVLSLAILIYGINREKTVEQEKIVQYELKQTQHKAGILCTSCIGIE